jgi:ribosomal protein L12E/L44/L45/RPP1/RPP2
MDLIDKVSTKTRQVDLIAAINRTIEVSNLIIRGMNMDEVLEAPMEFPEVPAPAPAKPSKGAKAPKPECPFGGEA